MYREVIAEVDTKIKVVNEKIDVMEVAKNFDKSKLTEDGKYAWLMGSLHAYEEMRQLLFTNQLKEDNKMIGLVEVLVRMLWQVSLGGNDRQINLFNEMNNISVGDLVMETSIGDNVPDIRKIGYLKQVEKEDDGWKHYYIECLDGKVIDWSNCSFIKIPTEYFKLTNY